MTATLSSMRKATFILGFLLLVSMFSPAFASPYSVALQADKAAYAGAQSIRINGTVSPAPGPNTGVVVIIRNPNGTTVDIAEDNVNATTGAFSQVTVTGGTGSWIPGTYSINATWGTNGAIATKAVTFSYSPVTVTSSSSGSSTTTTTVTTSSSTSTSSTPSTGSVSSSSSSSTTTTSSSSTTRTSSSSSGGISSLSSSSAGVTTSTPTTPSTTTTVTSIGTTASQQTNGFSLALYIIGAAILAALVLGIFGWRRRVARNYARQTTT